MTPKQRVAVRKACYEAALRHAKMREQRIGPDETPTPFSDKAEAALFLYQIRYEWSQNR